MNPAVRGVPFGRRSPRQGVLFPRRNTVSRDGRVLNVVVVRSSGSDMLDAAATTLLRDARMPSFPDAMPQPSVTITVAIRYTLDR